MLPSGPLYPTLHLQFVNAVLAMFETVVTGQEEQLAEPIMSL
jgi:hypothetical protein